MREVLSVIALIALLSSPVSRMAADAPRQDLHFDSGGVRIRYTVQGEGVPVILVHGFTATVEWNWDNPGITGALASQFRVIAMDCRGHGRSGKPHDPAAYGFHMVDDVIRLMDHLGVFRAHLAGYSMGGGIALQAVTTYPDRFYSVILGGAGWWSPGSRFIDATAVADSLEQGRGLGPLVAALNPVGQFPPTEEQIAAVIARLLARNDPLALAAVMRGEAGERQVTEERLRANRVPILAVVGELDPLRARVAAMALVASRLEVKVLPGKDHLSAIADPGLAASMREFLLRHAPHRPDIPRVWDDEVMARLEVPLARPRYSPRHVSSEFYYAIKVRPIYKSYDVYHPDREPAGYFESLKDLDPVVLWDDKGTRPRLLTDSDWIAAGEMVFDSPIGYGTGHLTATGHEEMTVRDREWYAHAKPPVTSDGRVPFYRYVVREKGKVELGGLSCSMCHTRVMPDGSVLKGAQGNFPFGRTFGYGYGRKPAGALEQQGALLLQRLLYDVPWRDGPARPSMVELPFEKIAALQDATPPGVIARHRSHPTSPVQVPDLIGVKDRRYLDRSGLQRHNGIGDLMRYAALNQGGDDLASFGGFVPIGVYIPGGKLPDVLPDGAPLDRYSDEQLYALALYLYSLKPPPNPNPMNDLARRGKEVFGEEDCGACHSPPLYSNNRLTPAPGFEVPDDHPDKDSIIGRRVGTDPDLTLNTRRGTGFYKVPSLRGVWYRSMFGHGGWCATLEDWFDPRRLEDDYQPTGWKGPPEVNERAVPGHEFGLDLDEKDRKALMAFLRTL